MNINLHDYVGNTVVVNFRNGSTWTASLERHDSWHYPFLLTKDDSCSCHSYTNGGRIRSHEEDHDYDIVRIRILYNQSPVFNSKLAELRRQKEDLERTLQETQTQLEKVQAQIEQAERDRLPDSFNREQALRFLADPTNTHALDWAFEWVSTPQGYLHWARIDNDPTKLTSDDIIQIQTWVIQSFYEGENASN